MSPLRFRTSRKAGPFRFTFTDRGVSTSVKVGGVSYNPRRRRATVNLPGPFSWTPKARKS
jgi:hypothetical protein